MIYSKLRGLAQFIRVIGSILGIVALIAGNILLDVELFFLLVLYGLVIAGVCYTWSIILEAQAEHGEHTQAILTLLENARRERAREHVKKASPAPVSPPPVKEKPAKGVMATIVRESQLKKSGQCSHCGESSLFIRVGDECPHCGALFNSESVANTETG